MGSAIGADLQRKGESKPGRYQRQKRQQRKDPEMGTCLLYLQNSQKASVAGMRGAGERVTGGQRRNERPDRARWIL